MAWNTYFASVVCDVFELNCECYFQNFWSISLNNVSFAADGILGVRLNSLFRLRLPKNVSSIIGTVFCLTDFRTLGESPQKFNELLSGEHNVVERERDKIGVC